MRPKSANELGLSVALENQAVSLDAPLPPSEGTAQGHARPGQQKLDRRQPDVSLVTSGKEKAVDLTLTPGPRVPCKCDQPGQLPHLATWVTHP